MSSKASKKPATIPAAKAPSASASTTPTPDQIRKAVEAELALLVPQPEECPICCKAFKAGETAMLPCGHTVCRPCLMQSATSTTTCLVCGTNVPAVASTKGLDGLPRNPFVEDKARKPQICQECQAEGVVTEHSVAQSRCMACAKDLCDGHELFHRRRPTTKDHQISALSVTAAADVCDQHKRPLDVYCVGCSELVCLGCTMKDGKHPAATHHTALLSEHFATLKANLTASRLAGTRSQLEAVNQITKVRSAVVAVNERADKLTAEVRSAFGVLQQALRSRESSILEQVVKLTSEERALLESSISAEQRRWLALQGGVALTDQLLAPTTTPVRVGQLSRTATTHVANTTRLPAGKLPQVDEIVLVVDSSVEQVLQTVGRLQFLRSFGPKCTAAGAGLSSAIEGAEAVVVVTGVSRSDDRVRVGGDRVEARLVPASAPSGDVGAGTACTVVDKGDGTYAVSYKSRAVGAYRLHVSVNGQPIQGSPFAVTVTPATKLFTYGGKLEFDNRGIIYHLATAGGTRPWTNPHIAGVVEVTGGPTVWNNVSDFVNNTVGSFYASGVGAWIVLNLKGRRVQPTGYMLGFYKGGYMLSFYKGGTGGQYAPRHWRLEGSNDGKTWTTLKTHTDDRSLNEGKEIAYWPLDREPNTAWSYFRLLSTGKNSSNGDHLLCSCMELYGTLLNP